MNVIDLLKEDHQEAINLIGVLETADDESGTDPIDTENFNRLHEALKMHSQIEEEFLYPLMAENDETGSWVKKAYQEHQKVDQLLVRLSTISPNQEEFQQFLAELRGDLQAHIEEEEWEFFPIIEERLGKTQLDQLGEQIQLKKLDSRFVLSAMKRS